MPAKKSPDPRVMEQHAKGANQVIGSMVLGAAMMAFAQWVIPDKPAYSIPFKDDAKSINKCASSIECYTTVGVHRYETYSPPDGTCFFEEINGNTVSCNPVITDPNVTVTPGGNP